jgi:hypothetical protein
MVEDHPLIVLIQSAKLFQWRFFNIGQSKYIIESGSHVESRIGLKNTNFVEDNPRNIPVKVGYTWFSGFRNEHVKS